MNISSPRSDQELINEADRGLRGQGAVVEMMGKLKNSISELNQTASAQQQKMLKLTRWITILTWVVALAAIAQIVLLVWQLRHKP